MTGDPDLVFRFPWPKQHLICNGESGRMFPDELKFVLYPYTDIERGIQGRRAYNSGTKSIDGDCVTSYLSVHSGQALLYHHCMPAEAAYFGVFEPDRRFSDPFFRMAYEWLEKEIGYYPVFFAVGEIESVLWMTGYDDNWRVWTGGECDRGTYRKTYRHKGEFPNLACFSFSDIDGIFMDFQSWHIALNACMNGGSVSEAERRMIFKPSWTWSRWITAARKGTHSVQLCAPDVPLQRAEHGYVRNSDTRVMLEKRGFPNIEVKRVKVGSS